MSAGSDNLGMFWQAVKYDLLIMKSRSKVKKLVSTTAYVI